MPPLKYRTNCPPKETGPTPQALSPGEQCIHLLLTPWLLPGLLARLRTSATTSGNYSIVCPTLCGRGLSRVKSLP